MKTGERGLNVAALDVLVPFGWMSGRPEGALLRLVGAGEARPQRVGELRGRVVVEGDVVRPSVSNVCVAGKVPGVAHLTVRSDG